MSKRKTIMVIGGAGYIGSHTVKMLLNAHYDVLVVDNLSTGHIECLEEISNLGFERELSFELADVRDKPIMSRIFDEYQIDGVIYLAADSLVKESIENPLKYFDNNDKGFMNLLEVMRDKDVNNLVFSSTAAIFGDANGDKPITEDMKQEPINPYGESKLIMEKMARWCDGAYGIKFVALRYFNAAGAELDGSNGESHDNESHLIPLLMKSIYEGTQFKIFGNDYDTPDGTNIRDYIHVLDLAQAHIDSLEYLWKTHTSDQFNLGTEHGISNLEIVRSVEKIMGHQVDFIYADRRGGDPDVLVADSSKINQALGWQPVYSDIDTIIKSVINWQSVHKGTWKKKESIE